MVEFISTNLLRQSKQQQWVQEFVEHATEHLYRIEQDLL